MSLLYLGEESSFSYCHRLMVWKRSIFLLSFFSSQKHHLKPFFSPAFAKKNITTRRHKRGTWSWRVWETTRNFLKILHCDDDDDGRKRMTKTTQLRHKKWVFRMWIFSFFYCLMNTQNFSLVFYHFFFLDNFPRKELLLFSSVLSLCSLLTAADKSRELEPHMEK